MTLNVLLRIFQGILLVILVGCSTPNRSQINELHQNNPQLEFLKKMSEAPERIWATSLSEKVKLSLQSFNNRTRVGRKKLEYGKTVRNLSLEGKTFDELDREITHLKCTKKQDVLKDPLTKQPTLTPSGGTVPMLVYLCPDGGVFRIKPLGDPTSRFRKNPHGSKALRYPYDSKFESFDDEIVKVDNAGHPVPKWAKDLGTISTDPKTQKEFIEGWADDAHTDLRVAH